MVNSEDFSKTSLSKLFQRAFNLSNKDGNVDEERLTVLHDILVNLKVGQKPPKRCLTYFQTFTSPWAENLKIEDRHARVYLEMSSWQIDRTRAGQNRMDKIQVCLIGTIMTLSMENVNLLEPDKVKMMRLQYVRMLHRYLKFKFKDRANNHLANGMKIYSLAEQALNIEKFHRLKWKLDFIWPLKKANFNCKH